MMLSPGFILMILSLVGIVIFSVVILSTKRSQARKKEEIRRTLHDEYSRKR